MRSGRSLSRRAVLAGCASVLTGPFSTACGLTRGRVPACPDPGALPRPRGLTATFFGASSVLFRDGDSAVLSDGFVTRVPKRALLARIESDRCRVVDTWIRLGRPRITAVFTGHSHYDHALDAPEFAKLTGATLLGSRSTGHIGARAGVPDAQFREVRSGDTVRCGAFELLFLPAVHGQGDLAPGSIDAPLPDRIKPRDLKTGTVWSVLVRHGQRRLLVHGSSGFVPGALRGHRADVVYLGIGRLRRDIDTYWNEVVVATGARRVVVVHWDDFFRSLDEPLRPMPGFARTMKALRRLAGRRVDVVLPCPWDPVDPFRDLPPRG